MKGLKILWRIMKNTGADRILGGFLLAFFACSIIIWLREPEIKTLGDGIWYCYAVVTTIGFGDVLVTTLLSRIISAILSVYAVLAIAIITGVVVNYYNELVELRKSETISAVLDRLEQLPEMSKEELVALSEKVHKLRHQRRSDEKGWPGSGL